MENKHEEKNSYPHICALAICLQWLIQMENKQEKKCSYLHICALAIFLPWLIQMENKQEKKMFISSHLCTCKLTSMINTNGRETWRKNDSHYHNVDQQLVVCFNDIMEE